MVISNGRNWTLVTGHAGFSPRLFHGVSTFDDRLWVIGGGGNNNDVWSSADGVNWTRETEHAGFSPRHGMAIVVYDNKIWSIGGMYYVSDSMGSIWRDKRGLVIA